MNSWHSYPKVYALGHSAVKELLNDEVVVQEKVDGSQFSFGIFDMPDVNDLRPDEQHYELKIRSKGAVMHVDAPEKMFNKAVETVKNIKSLLHPNWTYRAEYLAKPKHNTLAYDREPLGYLALFDINIGEEIYASYEVVMGEAARLGLDVVPLIHRGRIEDLQHFRAMLDRVSFLGGQKVEGVVVKNYHRYGPDKKVLMGKFVSEAFKEIHGGEWRANNPQKKDVIESLVIDLTTPTRWEKAVQHLREKGQLENSPRDIGKLIAEVQRDVEDEAATEIRERLFKHVIGFVRRGVVRGFPEWYKERLLKSQFDQS